jgi:hypothetical protein
LVVDDSEGFVFVNGASLSSQRPEFINFLKKMYPKSIIAFVFIDFYFYSRTSISERKRVVEKLSVFGGVKSLTELIDFYKERVDNIEFIPYNGVGNQSKYIGIVK